MELCSTSNSAFIPIFKHQLPIHPWISIFHPTIIRTAFNTQPLIIMSNPDALRSVFEDHSHLEMDNLAKPNPILRLKRSIRSLQATRRQQCPIIALPIDPQPTPTVPTVVSKLSAPASNNIAIASGIPTDPLFPPRL